MPKSKRHQKRRKKIKKHPNKVNRPWDSGGIDNQDFDGPYMKTDGQGRVCKYSASHKFLGYATEEESKNF